MVVHADSIEDFAAEISLDVYLACLSASNHRNRLTRMSWKTLHVPDEWIVAINIMRRRKIRILVDESLGSDAAEFLRKKGYSALFTGDVGLNGKSDTQVAAYAWRQKRMVWTSDHDFLDDRVVPEHRNPGIVVLPSGDRKQAAIIRGIIMALEVFGRGPDLWLKSKSVISPTGEITIRQREFDTGKMNSTRFRFTKSGDTEMWEDD